MKKVLIVSSVASMIDQFLIPHIKLLINNNYQVTVACNFIKGSTCNKVKIEELKIKLNQMNVSFFQIDFSRNIINLFNNGKAYKQLKKIINGEKFDLIYCHSPIGGVLSRLAARKKRKFGTKVIYMAHGFHFFKGSSFKNWLLFYPIEKFCSRFTDILITINKEDYDFATRKMKANRIVYLPGVGIDLNKFKKANVDRELKFKELGIPSDAIVFLSVGELNSNKNHELVIRAISNIDNVYYLVAGRGELNSYLINLVKKLNLENRVKLLGFRSDVNELCKISNIYIMPSYREGLSVALMEAMASGLPCIVSKIRGNVDLIDENGGSLFDPSSVDDCKKSINFVLSRDLKKLGSYNSIKIKEFSIEEVSVQLTKIIKSI